METHANHLHHAPGKKLRHYFFEFLMLFVAVFCGFLAENLREERVERHHEKDFILSLIEDLKKDTANVNSDSVDYQTLVLLTDSVFANFDALSGNYNKQLYDQLGATLGFPDFIYNDKTMQQLKSAGNMRLIQNKLAVDSMIAYDTNIRDYMLDVDVTGKIFYDYQTLYFSVIDKQREVHDLKSHTAEELEKSGKNYLISKDPEKLAMLRNKLMLFYGSAIYNTRREKGIKERAVRLMQVLRREYHLN